MDIVLFFLPITEFIISTYVFGLGLIISRIFYTPQEIKNYIYEICLIGFCIAVPIMQGINFFLPISNIIFIVTYLIALFFIYLNRNILIGINKKLKKLFLIFIILIPFKFVIKGNEDLYYHLPKVEFLTQYKIIFGLANINPSLAFTNGWAHVSSAFNFLNGGEKNLYLVSYVFYVMSIMTFYSYLKTSNTNIIKVLTPLIICFFLIKFYRLQEFGNDYQATIFLFLIFFLCVYYFFEEKNDVKLLNKIIFFSFFAFIFRIYSVFIISIILIFIFNRVNLIKIINKKLLFIILITTITTSLTSYINSGCLYMPIEKTCFKKENSSWTYSNISGLNTHLKSFNTSYNDYKKIEENKLTQEEWIKNFNWFKFHIQSERFVKPLVKTTLFLIIIYSILVVRFNPTIDKYNKKKLIFLLSFSLSFMLWLFITPLFRAGGYAYYSIIIILCLIFSVKTQKIELKKLRKISVFFFIIFTLLNLMRINSEYRKYNTLNPFFFLQWHTLNPAYFSIYNELKSTINSNTNEIENINELKIFKKNGYWFIES